ncbi:protein of unknown function [Nitrosotalea devaniterrae]|uniref:Uncharacterized protein n=1 Tax=Nitrosotalea devaniterrae TaxID=1078905 RepID=A0A128A0Y5_9ARCH|nr:protein of unknown function [Candidatus Nitrosotalea devanaterra]
MIFYVDTIRFITIMFRPHMILDDKTPDLLKFYLSENNIEYY